MKAFKIRAITIDPPLILSPMAGVTDYIFRGKIIFLLLVAIFTCAASEVFACSCLPSAPCQSFGRADVVFLGKAVGSKLQTTVEEYENFEGEAKKTTYDVGEIYFEVIEGFKGVKKGAKVAINSSTGGGDCGQWFLRGETYVVFASKEGSDADSRISSLTYGGEETIERKPDPERLWTTICAGNRHVSTSEETLRYLRDLPNAPGGGLIVGTILESIRDYSNENLSAKPMAGTRVSAKSLAPNGKEFFGTSDENGKFSLNIPFGKYLVRPVLDEFLRYDSELHSRVPEINVTDRECVVETFWVSNDSLISGTVLDSAGKPVNDISLELIPSSKGRGDKGFDRERKYVSDKGEFEFEGIPPGKYNISLNYTVRPDDDSPYPTVFYPLVFDRAKATVFEIELGTHISGLVFRMPRKLSKNVISGTVVWKDGKPAANAEVQLVDTEYGRDVFFKAPLTDPAGKFKMEWFSGRRYKINVIVWEKAEDGSGFGVADAQTEEFILNDETGEMKIVLNTINPREKSYTRTTVRSN